MKTYTLKSVVRRGSMLAAAFAVVLAAVAPAASIFADALNPLTERSLTLSSSSPGWSYLDASGNPTFAPPNSGANGNKAGNTFSFRVSSAADIKGLSFQYCTTPAGACMGPGNNSITGTAPSITARAANGTTEYGLRHSDLELKSASPSEVTTYGTKFDVTTGQPAGSGLSNPFWDSNTAHPNLPARDNSEGNFIVLYKANLGDSWSQSTGWDMAATVKQTNSSGAVGTLAAGTTTEKANYATLVNSTVDSMDLQPGNYVKVIFFATDTNYIINPGDKEFFVKINTFNTDVPANFDTSESSTTIIDGGVTVANVMNRSIEIQTKVLETMDFSVGTVDPNTLASTGSSGSQFELATGKDEHGPCDPIVQGLTSATANNVLKLGNEAGEFSLRTDTTYSTHSYWRLSSNSSGGATVYYSGITLSNTVGDQIDAIGAAKKSPSEGSEQFGLALDNETTGSKLVDYSVERTGNDLFENAEDNVTNGVDATTTAAVGANLSYHAPQLTPLTAKTDYSDGSGNVNTEYGTVNTKFAFDPESTAVPTPFAEGTQVLDCATGKMRYIANIAATTPAGIYTTKINYIASPKY
ncbi:MAG: hypothetical protein ACOH18_00355 [Candidatus Saccharimonadaceae bacterium]